jgi:flagella basal body P-ring formation protein FlgA
VISLRAPTLYAMTAILLMIATVATADSGGDSWRGTADNALMTALRVAYPNVADWHIVPLIGDRQLRRLQAAGEVGAVAGRLGKRSSVRITGTQGGHPFRATVWFAVDGMQQALSARSRIPAGATVTPADFDYVNQDILALTCTALTSPDGLAGMRTKRTLQASETLCTELIEPRPTVSRGDSVLVRSTAGAVTITAKAMAQQDGKLGQLVRVRNPSSGEIYPASVSGVGEVVVRE